MTTKEKVFLGGAIVAVALLSKGKALSSIAGTIADLGRSFADKAGFSKPAGSVEGNGWTSVDVSDTGGGGEGWLDGGEG